MDGVQAKAARVDSGPCSPGGVVLARGLKSTEPPHPGKTPFWTSPSSTISCWPVPLLTPSIVPSPWEAEPEVSRPSLGGGGR